MVFRYAKKKKEGKFLQGDQISDKERARERSDLKIPLGRKLNQLFIEWFFDTQRRRNVLQGDQISDKERAKRRTR